MNITSIMVYAIEIKLIRRPQRPKRKGPSGTAFLPVLRIAMSEIGSKYDMYWPIKEIEVIALKAVEDQMLMRPRDIPTTVISRVVRTGIK